MEYLTDEMKPKCLRKYLPNPQRVWWALWRCSRDKWISPDDVYRLGHAFSFCVNRASPSITMRSAVQGRIDVQSAVCLGMVRGKPPFQRNEASFFSFKEYLKRVKKPKPVKVELEILRLKIKDLK
jgi:hypothetical protein